MANLSMCRKLDASNNRESMHQLHIFCIICNNVAMSKTLNSVSHLVCAARGEESRAAFAARLGVLQSSLSRYENGKVSPPAEVLNKCLELVSQRSAIPSAETIAREIRHKLSGVHNEPMRSAIWTIIRGGQATGQEYRSSSDQ